MKIFGVVLSQGSLHHDLASLCADCKGSVINITIKKLPEPLHR